MYGIQYLFDGGLRKFMFRQVEVVRLTRRVRKILTQVTTHSPWNLLESLPWQSSNSEQL
jgi:hypothetical protein